jgi:uncharacterized cysteine cluster protein YcgN (CxxCxxCC family)
MKPFFETKTLAEMTKAEWESLCDGCGKCCVYVIEDEETDDVYETDVACRLFDVKKRRCTDYENRSKRVPDCVRLTAKIAPTLSWLPDTCAYRLLSEGKKLPKWHPLRTGDRDSVVRAGIAVGDDLMKVKRVTDAVLKSRIVGKR